MTLVRADRVAGLEPAAPLPLRTSLQQRDACDRSLTQPEPLEVGDRIEIGGSAGIIRAVEPILGEHEMRLVVRLVSTDDTLPTSRAD